MLTLARHCNRGVCALEGYARIEPATILSARQERAEVMNNIQHQQVRNMARARNYYIRGASNKQNISEETRDLLRNARNPDDHSTRLGPGIQEPLVMDPRTPERKRALQHIVKYRGEMINDAEDTVKYYPHEGEEIPNIQASPVLMVKRVKPLKGEPNFNKVFCDQVGLGIREKMSKLSFLPNIPSVTLLLFKIKHLIEITPVTFPNGMPDDFDPETHGFKLTHRGEFIVHPSLKMNLDDIVDRAELMKITKHEIHMEGLKNFKTPFSTILGHNQTHQDTRWRDNSKADSQYIKNKRMKWTEKK